MDTKKILLRFHKFSKDRAEIYQIILGQKEYLCYKLAAAVSFKAKRLLNTFFIEVKFLLTLKMSFQVRSSHEGGRNCNKYSITVLYRYFTWPKGTGLIII